MISKGGVNLKTTGERIKQRRTELGWSLREMAKRMGYANQSTIARIEAGAIDLPQSKVVKFAEVLNTSVAFLMGWEEMINADPVGTAELHFEMIMDEDLHEIFEDFKWLDAKEKKIVKDLAHSLAENKKSEA